MLSIHNLHNPFHHDMMDGSIHVFNDWCVGHLPRTEWQQLIGLLWKGDRAQLSLPSCQKVPLGLNHQSALANYSRVSHPHGHYEWLRTHTSGEDLTGCLLLFFLCFIVILLALVTYWKQKMWKHADLQLVDLEGVLSTWYCFHFWMQADMLVKVTDTFIKRHLKELI